MVKGDDHDHDGTWGGDNAQRTGQSLPSTQMILTMIVLPSLPS